MFRRPLSAGICNLGSDVSDGYLATSGKSGPVPPSIQTGSFIKKNGGNHKFGLERRGKGCHLIVCNTPRGGDRAQQMRHKGNHIGSSRGYHADS